MEEQAAGDLSEEDLSRHAGVVNEQLLDAVERLANRMFQGPSRAAQVESNLAVLAILREHVAKPADEVNPKMLGLFHGALLSLVVEVLNRLPADTQEAAVDARS
jgi:hypothetical protein